LEAFFLKSFWKCFFFFKSNLRGLRRGDFFPSHFQRNVFKTNKLTNITDQANEFSTRHDMNFGQACYLTLVDKLINFTKATFVWHLIKKWLDKKGCK
jgi:hypothetical protein